MTINFVFAVGLGGAIGSIFRYLANLTAMSVFGVSFPWGTLFVNILGSLLMGILSELFVIKGAADPAIRLFLTAGLCGGFTTFSAFSLDTYSMIERGAWLNALTYTSASVILSLIALIAGLYLVRTAA